MDYQLDDVIEEMEDIRHSPDMCYACDKCGPGSDQCYVEDAIGYLKEYRAMLNKSRRERLVDILREVRGEK